MTIGENGANIDLNTGSFAFLDSSRLKTIERCKTRITAFALPDRTSSSRLTFHYS